MQQCWSKSLANAKCVSPLRPERTDPHSASGAFLAGSETSYKVVAPHLSGHASDEVLARRLMLADFRSYASLDLSVDARLVVLTGENGAGKTNLLEALSLFSPGRGLRRAELSEFARVGGGGGFAVSAEIETSNGVVQLGTGIEPQGDLPLQRKYRVNREHAASIRAVCNHLRVVWLTPAMDGLFSGPAGDRRRFLDRLVLAIDTSHGARVNAFERALRSRNRLLEDGPAADRRWLDAIEKEAAELAIAIAAARAETVSKLSALIAETRDNASAFPWADLGLEGDVERLIGSFPAVESEEIYRGMLRENRSRDAQAGRALIGPQAADLCVRHGPKQILAAKASTGEQKALLAGLALAHARLVAAVSGLAPLVLLDEIAAHFDPLRRDALFEALKTLGGQIWLSGADRAIFSAIENHALMLTVTPGAVTCGSFG
jgi:DNA replication and repair protein RecF